MEDKEEGTEIKSEFNSSMDQLQRISRLMYRYDDFALNGDLSKSFDVLKIIHDELEFSFNKKERDFVNEQEKKLDDFLNSLKIYIDDLYFIEGRSFFKFPKERKGFENALRIYHRILRRLMNEKGMLMKAKSDTDLF